MNDKKNFSEKTFPIRNSGMHRINMEKAKVKNIQQTIGRLWKYVRLKKFAFSLALVCVIANTVFTLVASYMIRPIVNGIVEGSSMNVLVENLIFMFIVYVLAVSANYLKTRIMLEIAQKSLESLRTDLFVKLQRLPLKYFDTNSNGDIMSRFANDVDAISQMLSSTLVQVISGAITVVGTLALMLYTNWILAIVTIIMVPVFRFAAKFISEKSRKFYKQQQQSLGALNGFVEETITGQKVIKVFNHEKEVIRDFKKINNNYRHNIFRAQFFGGMMGPVMGSLGQLNYAMAACIGGLLCVFRGFDIGGYTVFVNYARSFSRPITDISMQMNTIFLALAGAERVFEVMDEAPEADDNVNAIVLQNMKGNIVIKNVNFCYRKDKMVLKDISLYAKPGQKIAFVGSTGAGKTTITNVLNRFYDIETGCITIDGIDIKDFKKSYLRENIAMVLQDTHLFTGTVMENIRYGRLDASDEEVIEVAIVANADPFIRRLEHGYNTMLDGDGANLSQGQRQLLNIARAAISKAPILVLDEATSSVDTRTEKHIEQALDRLMETRTTLVIAHRLSTVRNANAIMVLEDGRIIERGEHDELLAQKGRYYSLYAGLAKLD